MKIWQIALLGGMAALDCLVLVAGAVLVFGSIASKSPDQIAAAAQNPSPALTTVPQPTVEPFPLPSDTPTPLDYLFATFTPFGTLPENPTFTPTATSSMEGWVKVSVREVEIWMPGSYAAGNPHTDAKAIIASLKEKGANFNFDYIEKQMTTSLKYYVLWGIDSFQGNPNIVTNVAILYDYPNPGEPLADYATRFIGAMSGDFRLVEQRKITSRLYEIERVTLESKSEQGTPEQVMLYAVRDQNIIWDVLCVTAVDEMTNRLPAFDLMVATFRALAAPQ